MKKTILLLIFVATAVLTFAQVPQSFSYQAVIRDAGNNLISSQSVDVRISLISGSTTEYVETHTVTTTQYGLINLTIGDGTLVSGDFSIIDWSDGNQSVKVEVDAGSGYEDLGSNDLQSVPYALASGDNYWTENNYGIYTTQKVGIGTSAVTHPLTVNGYSTSAVTAGSLNSNNSALHLRNSAASTGRMTGLTFGISGLSTPVGAGIFFERTGSNSQGALHFATKESITVDTLLPIRMTIDADGMVGIGTTAPTTTFTIFQHPFTSFTVPGDAGLSLESSIGSSRWTIYNSNDYLSFAVNNARLAYVNSSSGAWTLSSDKRLKENITNMEPVLDRINQLQVVRYNFIGRENSNTIGFIAQDVLPLFPEVVSKDKGEDGYYGVAYGNMSIIAIQAIQEQQVIIEEQEIKIEEQETKIEKQDAKIDDLQTQIDELRNMIQQ